MLSMPPATITRASPRRTACEASMTAFNPEPHTLLMVSAATVGGSPALRAACRAGACPTPADRISPIMTSSTSRRCRPARNSAARMAIAPSSGAGISLRAPRNLPMGVRAPESTYASLMLPAPAAGKHNRCNSWRHSEVFRDEDPLGLPMITITEFCRSSPDHKASKRRLMKGAPAWSRAQRVTAFLCGLALAVTVALADEPDAADSFTHESAHQPVLAIMGEVARPGAYELPISRPQLLDLVNLAGGRTQEASGSVRIIRGGRPGWQAWLTPAAPFPLRPDDLVIVDSVWPQSDRRFTADMRNAPTSRPASKFVQLGIV